MNRVKSFLHNKCMALYGNLTFHFVCFGDMQNNGITFILWAPFLTESSAQKRHSYVTQTCKAIYGEQPSFTVNLLV